MLVSAAMALALALPAPIVVPAPNPLTITKPLPTYKPSPAPVVKVTPTKVTADGVFDGKSGAYTVGAFDKGVKYVRVEVTGQPYIKTQVQQKVNGKWIKKFTIGEGTASSYHQYLDVNGTALKSKTGLSGKPGTSGVFRLYVPATSTTSASWTAEKTIVWAKPQVHQAKALPFGKGSKVTVNTTSGFLYSKVALPNSIQKAYVERKNGNKWVVEATLTANAKKTATNQEFWVYLPAPGSSHTYRLRIDATTTHSQFISASQVLYKAQEKTKINHWQTGPKTPVASYQQGSATGWVTGGSRPVELQKWNGKKWVKAVSTKTAKDGVYDVKTPKTAATTKYSYRLNFPATKTHTGVVGSKFVASHVNPRTYTGYKKTIYNHVKKWCPNIVIDTAKQNGKWDGQAHIGQNRISVVTGKSGNRLKHISLHECGHMLQDWTYKNAWKQGEKRMNVIYATKGSQGIEKGADCVAKYIGSPGPFSYNSNCKGYRGTAGKLIAQGKKP